MTPGNVVSKTVKHIPESSQKVTVRTFCIIQTISWKHRHSQSLSIFTQNSRPSTEEVLKRIIGEVPLSQSIIRKVKLQNLSLKIKTTYLHK